MESHPTEKRAQFDFEIDFLNGGGIQGQGFRLDIEWEDIADDTLAEYIVRDLRLLMVGQVRIRNKSILAEPHKRRSETVATAPMQRTRFIELSHTIEDGMITYKGLPAPFRPCQPRSKAWGRFRCGHTAVSC